MWSEPLCGGDPGEIVNFTDPELEKCILDGLGGNPPPSDITVETAARQTSVSCPGRGITDLGGLEAFTALTSLDLTGNALTGFAISLDRKSTRLNSRHYCPSHMPSSA